MSSWFSVQDPTAPNFSPVTSTQKGWGQLTDTDTAWACATDRGFRSETQTWYTILTDGTFVMCQVIWSYTGIFLVPAQTQLTFKLYNPHTKKLVWRSLNASGFKPSADGRGGKANEFEIKHTGSASGEETYALTGSLDKTVQISINFTKPATAPGFKLGQGPEGGYSYFGKDNKEGLVIHRFHPLVKSTGSLIIDGAVVDATGEAMFVHAIQGMRPDSVASRWNFAFFTSGGGEGQEQDEKHGDVRAVMMEFETTDGHGPKGPKSGRTKACLGAIYSSKATAPLTVVGQTISTAGPEAFPSASSDECTATHVGTAKDAETGYTAPLGLAFHWKSVGDGVEADATIPAGIKTGENGLIEKVDVLAEIPYLIRKGLAAVTGTKPIIYQYLSPATLDLVVKGDKSAVKGWLFSEATFVSE